MQKSFEQWLSWMESCHPEEIELGLGRCKRVLERLLTKRYDFPVITVAGTNGKGSTIAVLESLSRQANIKPLVYTSPHLQDYRERLKYDGQWLTKKQHVEAFRAVEVARNAEKLTYFEFATLAALKCAEWLQPDILILETGLGGRLDAVNILQADIAIITTIDYDHQDWLGDDLVSIAREKAGIIHQGKKAIIADPFFPEVVLNEIKLVTGKVQEAGKNYQYQENDHGWYWTNDNHGPWHFSALPFPVSNAAAALEAWSLLPFGVNLSETSVRQALSKIEISGRFEILKENPAVIIDVAHNPQAMCALTQQLEKQQFEGKTHLVLGMLEDKNAEVVIDILKEVIDYWYLTDLDTRRGRSANHLKQLINRSEIDKNQVQCYTSPIEAYEAAHEHSASKDRILVTGSFYTVAPVLNMFQIDNKNNKLSTNNSGSERTE